MTHILLFMALSFNLPPSEVATKLMFARTVTDVSVVLATEQKDCLHSQFRQCRFKDVYADPISFLDFKWDENLQIKDRNIWLRIPLSERRQIFEKLIDSFGEPDFKKGGIEEEWLVAKWILTDKRFVSFVHDASGLTVVRRGFGTIPIFEE